jgi:hypothetical protein
MLRTQIPTIGCEVFYDYHLLRKPADSTLWGGHSQAGRGNAAALGVKYEDFA